MYKGKRFLVKDNWAVVFLICLAMSAMVIILLSLMFALVSNMSNDPTGNLGIFSLLTVLLAAAASGFATAKIKKENAIGFSALVSLATVLIMLLSCVIMNGKVSGSAFMNYICYIGVATLFSLLGAREKSHKRHRR